jgi:hypothetical protein
LNRQGSSIVLMESDLKPPADPTKAKPAKSAPQSGSIEERRRREAEALRQNLLRRKEQTRARRDPKP